MAVKAGLGIADDMRPPPAFLDGQDWIKGNLLLEPDTAGADDAAFHIQNNEVPERIALREMLLLFIIKAAVPRPVADG